MKESKLKIIDRPSPNFDARDHGVDMIVLHYTGMQTGEEAISRLCDEEAKVSAHYAVEEDGRVFSLVPEEDRAWHAGVSSWRGATNINARSVGIEIVNPGHEWGYRAFPEAQMASVISLVGEIAKRHCVPKTRVVGHSDVAPARKEDPGELFPWGKLAAAGLCVGPFTGAAALGVDYGAALSALRNIGYDAPEGAHAAAVLAFQRRFCPASLGQGLDPLTRTALIWAAQAMAG
jgi:N-acetylmuramoyl-L-alanine amidase